MKSVKNSVEIADRERHPNAWQWKEANAAQNAMRFGNGTRRCSLTSRLAGNTPNDRIGPDKPSDASLNLASLLRKRASGS